MELKKYPKHLIDSFTDSEKITKKIQNIFLLYEEYFALSINYTIESCYDFENNKSKTDDCIKYIKKNRIYVGLLEEFVNTMIKHLMVQICENDSINIKTYLESQKLYAEEFKPNNRRNELNQQFLLYISNWNEEILNLNYVLTDSEVLKFKYFFNTYSKYYKVLRDKIIGSLNNVLEGSSLSDNEASDTLTKQEKFRNDVKPYGFFDLEKVKGLNHSKQIELIKLITTSTPYAIAMFDFLGFLKVLERDHFDTKSTMTKKISHWLRIDPSGRNVRGQINSLIEYSKENGNRYTAWIHVEKVKADYQKLI